MILMILLGGFTLKSQTHADSLLLQVAVANELRVSTANAYFNFLLQGNEHSIIWEGEAISILDEPRLFGNVVQNVRENDTIKVLGYVYRSSNKPYLVIQTSKAEGYISAPPKYENIFKKEHNSYIQFWLNNGTIAMAAYKTWMKDQKDETKPQTVERTIETTPSVAPRTHKTPKPNTYRKIYTGPRGGKYYINSKGNKVYIKQ